MRQAPDTARDRRHGGERRETGVWCVVHVTHEASAESPASRVSLPCPDARQLGGTAAAVHPPTPAYGEEEEDAVREGERMSVREGERVSNEVAEEVAAGGGSSLKLCLDVPSTACTQS